MREELDNQLSESYPKLFINRYGNIQETAMCWGFDCGDGWFDLIDTLCDNIQRYLDQNKNVPQVVVEQVKEKFGTLRFYVEGGDQMTNGMIWFAESMSGRLCETCGKPGKIRGKSWYYTACDEHTREEHRNV
jgi:hypothetical protein